MARVARKNTEAPTQGRIQHLLELLLQAKSRQSADKAVQDSSTKELKAIVETSGYTDANGHIWLDLDTPVGEVAQLQMQRKVSTTLDEERATTLLKAKGIYAQCTTTVVVLDQDEIMAAHYRGELTEAELDSLFTKSVNFALMTPKAK